MADKTSKLFDPKAATPTPAPTKPAPKPPTDTPETPPEPTQLPAEPPKSSVDRKEARRKELLAENPDIQALVDAAHAVANREGAPPMSNIFERVAKGREVRKARRERLKATLKTLAAGK